LIACSRRKFKLKAKTCLYLRTIEWRNLMAENEVYDLAIVGGGPGGLTAKSSIPMPLS
jgi:ribulose 1,5-bisphosphate synthetase/thiazole synthase